MSESHHQKWVLFGLILVATILSVGTAFVNIGCYNCKDSVLPHFSLALAGGLFYAALSVMLISNRWPRQVAAGVFLAAGIHFELIVFAIRLRLWCIPCLLCGVVIIVAAVVCYFSRPETRRLACLILPVGAIIIGVYIQADFVRAGFDLRRVEVAASVLSQSITTERGSLVIFQRPGCRYCESLRTEIIPTLLTDFPHLKVSYQIAPNGFPAPVVVVKGRIDQVFVGVPLRTDLLKALLVRTTSANH
jgi:ABC-type uncharacterized transport system permease subunit